MSPSKVSAIVFDKFYNIVDGKQRSAAAFHNGIDPSTGQKNWDVSVFYPGNPLRSHHPSPGSCETLTPPTGPNCHAARC